MPVAPPEARGTSPSSGRPSSTLFRQMLEQLDAAHQREVHCLEETISGLTRQLDEAVGISGHDDPGARRESSEASIRPVPASRLSRHSDPGCTRRGTGAAAPRGAQEAPPNDDEPPELSPEMSPSGNPRRVTIEPLEDPRTPIDEEGSSVSSAEADVEVEKKRSNRSDQEKDQKVGELGRGQYVWQWQRSKGGFRNYPDGQNASIEEAYRRGHSKVRLKSGEQGKVPMEIFFVDMMQLDPKSRNLRKVRRLGPESWYLQPWRHVQALARSLFLGAPRWESLAKYKRRQQSLGVGVGAAGCGDGIASISSAIAMSSVGSFTSGTPYDKADNVCSRITESSAFVTTSMLVMMLNVIWIGVSVELDDFNATLWDRHESSIILEFGFMIYFFVEVVIQFLSLKFKSAWYHNTWFCVDALCTGIIMVEILIIPYTPIRPDAIPALSILRLVKLARLVKLVREIKDIVIILRGVASGMRSAVVIWMLIAALLYTCSVLLTTATSDESRLKRKYFGSMGQTVTTLVAHGIALDGLGELFNDFRMENALFQAVVFSMFVFLTYFGLLNMLVGAFCNVAIDVADVEEDLAKVEYLHKHLEGIVECYMEGHDDRISSEKFQLLMKNADVLQTLLACGTDVDGLMMLTDVLFPYEDSSISFPEFFAVIARLRKGKPASVSDVIGLQEFTKQRFDFLEEHILRGVETMETTTPMSSRVSTPNETGRKIDQGGIRGIVKARAKLAEQGSDVLPEMRKDYDRMRMHWLVLPRGSKELAWHTPTP